MSHELEAIYDGGVLRPLEPLPLPDQTRVKVTVELAPQEPKLGDEISAAEAETVAKQRKALQQLWKEVEAMPQHRNNDGWSVVDHDRLLYDELQLSLSIPAFGSQPMSLSKQHIKP